MRKWFVPVVGVTLIVFLPSRSQAQAVLQIPPPLSPSGRVWTLALSGGVALTSGNSNTSSVNVAYDVTYEPATRNLVKSDALFLRGKSQGNVSNERLGFNVRTNTASTPERTVFGQHQFLRDRFKNIGTCWRPRLALAIARLTLSTPGSTLMPASARSGKKYRAGPAEVDRLFSRREILAEAHRTTTLTQSVTALWKTNNLDDALYTFGVSVAAAVSTRIQLKVEAIDTFKNIPPVPSRQKNDVATLIAIVYKISGSRLQTPGCRSPKPEA